MHRLTLFVAESVGSWLSITSVIIRIRAKPIKVGFALIYSIYLIICLDIIIDVQVILPSCC
ncbi:hypothetical protein SAMN02746066_04235 [Anaerosporobacter mobilis DSM 15930]|jgi:hypothetical protein|uniref:Uncharacterized protein n=1 Tax=Anaerosporobacter mobilis DSM 15930 TaxID=1120996 RepID=A0A1M7N5N4_9FIRM|nr:hypothetical protein SAMN02746066_04235 [Anaerosporobacter mobilis DSM 15930]